MVPVHCIYRSHRLKYIFKMKTLKILLFETSRLRALIFGIEHHQVDLYPVCSNDALGAKNDPIAGSHVLHRLIYEKT